MATPPLDPGRALRRLTRAINVPMRHILSLPFPTPLSKRLMLLILTGRRTGKIYRQPVSYVRQGDVLLTPGGGNWTLNLHPGQPERIRLAGHDITACPDLVEDLDEIDELMTVITVGNPAAGRFVPIPRGGDGHLDRTALANAVAHGFRIIRWRGIDTDPAAGSQDPSLGAAADG
jgi:hypothetical protein